MTIAAILGIKGHEVISIGGDMRVAEAVALFAERRIGAVPVLEGDSVAGVFSERDVIYCLASEGSGALDRPVRELMTAPAVTVGPDMSALGALAMMTHRRMRHLPVVERSTLVGLVSIGDLVKYRIERIESEADAMRDYIRQA